MLVLQGNILVLGIGTLNNRTDKFLFLVSYNSSIWGFRLQGLTEAQIDEIHYWLFPTIHRTEYSSEAIPPVDTFQETGH